jgi:peptidoglycan/LPS O-acetylase OafA/YrhL
MSVGRKSPNLDFLRSLAVLLVLGSQISLAFGLPWEGTATAAAGHLGVLLFFIHTSLVLMMSLARLKKSQGGLAARFYIRRAFRIYPLAIVATGGQAGWDWRSARVSACSCLCFGKLKFQRPKKSFTPSPNTPTVFTWRICRFYGSFSL